jgi:hypothetical protein
MADCFVCSKSYATRQGFESHISLVKKKCYEGSLSTLAGFSEYCSSNNRSYYETCNAIFTQRDTCLRCGGGGRVGWYLNLKV